MDAIKFLKEWRRMCIAHDNNCRDACGEKCVVPCPMRMDEMSDERIDFTAETIKRWSAEHPLKTRLDDLKEKHPHFELRDDGYPVVLPRVFGYCGENTNPAYCGRCEKMGHGKDCWDTPLEEQSVTADNPHTCEGCKYRRLIDGKYRCYGVLPEGYGCGHWKEKE